MKPGSNKKKFFCRFDVKFFHQLHRLKRLSKSEIPRMAFSKIAHWLDSFMERIIYSPQGPYFPQPAKPLRSIGVFDASVLSPGFAERYRLKYPAEADTLIKQADLAEDRVFDLLGSGTVDLKKYGDDFWHVDFISGYRWERATFFSDVPHGSPAPAADIKVPWELSRCQHFVTIAQAYALTRDEKYARAYISQMESWIDSNPPKFGVNWSCAMDVALRACNWLAAWDVFQHSPLISKEFEEKLASSLWEHGNHIYRHLEWGGSVSTNHYLSDLLGLFYIGLALGVKKFRVCAQGELARELFHQTYDDGFDYEGSTAYHRLALEIFHFYAAVCGKNAKFTDPLGAVFLERLESMYEVVNQLAAPDGTVPILGDNDSGRIHVFLKREDADMSYLSAMGCLLLNKEYLKTQEWAGAAEIPWLFGWEGTERLEQMKGRAAKTLPPKKPSPSGLLTLRTPESFLVFNVAPNGTRGVGGHTHNDKLSFCLWVKGEWFLSDPGTGVYTSDPALRNRLRSTRAHNTVEVGGEEQNRINPSSLFALEDDAKTRVVRTWSDGIEAAHTGYERLGVVHQRSIEMKNKTNGWIVTDTLSGEGPVKAAWFFHAPPSVKVECRDGLWCLLGKNGFLEFQSVPGNLTSKLITDIFSPHYGTVIKAPVLVFEGSLSMPASMEFQLIYREYVARVVIPEILNRESRT